MRHQRQIVRTLAICLLLVVGISACGASSAVTGEFSLVSPTEAAAVLAEWSPEVVLLDVRTPEEFGQGHVPGALNVDFYANDFAARLDGLARDVPYVVYCRSGNRSAQAITIMRDQGFSQVWDVDGGIVSWTEAGLPLAT